LEDVISNEYTLTLDSTSYDMTFVMGCRCSDGIILVADRKITSINALKSISFDYKQKMFGVLGGVVFGSSGSTDTFELFRDHIVDQVRSRDDIKFENIMVKLAEIVLDMNKE
jgi:20S proteasome alpha/beta subunit